MGKRNEQDEGVYRRSLSCKANLLHMQKYTCFFFPIVHCSARVVGMES